MSPPPDPPRDRGRLAVLASGSGTILEAIVDAGIRVDVVVSDRPCRALTLAEGWGVPAVLVARDRFDRGFDRAGYTDGLIEALVAHEIQLVAMAGFMTVLAAPMFAAFPGRVVNTHPSLLPAFPGAHAVREALAAGVRVTGCTVHLATEQVDHGPILAQEAVPVLVTDDESTLHERIKAVERRLYPQAIKELPRVTTSPPRTALLSVFDKSGVVELAAGLHELGWRLVSSGGTARAIAEAGLPVTDVADLTGVPAILGHRVVTLHPKVHGGILADVDDPTHQADLAAYGIEPISLVVANLYPFGEQPGIEMIDVGGPAMVRAAAKNHAHVGVLVEPSAYDGVLDELRRDGWLSADTRRRLARAGFAHTAAYDAAIVTWLDATAPDGPPILPATLHLALERAQDLRYGENPHQQGARYRAVGQRSWWDGAVQLGGKELSYLNLYDGEAAWRLVHRLGDRPAAVVVKHANPCGAAVADELLTAYERAHAGDPVSAFGGIVALNRPMTAPVAAALADVFTEVVIAPAFEDGALEVLASKKNLRLLAAPAPGDAVLDVRAIDGGLLVQEADRVTMDRAAWQVVTAATPTDAQWIDLELAWLVCAAVSSNAIVFVRDGQAVGIGGGQPNRVHAARIAAEKADGRAVGGACASDAYFPFRDGLDTAAAAGVTAVIQPGGSIRDAEVIAAADEHGIAMVFTGERHFRH